jgi:hypothetical protein
MTTGKSVTLRASSCENMGCETLNLTKAYANPLKTDRVPDVTRGNSSSQAAYIYNKLVTKLLTL